MHNSWRAILLGTIVFVMYASFIWRRMREYQGDRFIEFGSLAILCLLLSVWLKRLPGIPDWIFGSMTVLMYFLCVAALIYMFQQIYRAIRKKLTKHDD